MTAQSGDASSRYQINQRVAGVLIRHDIDLETLSISSSSRLVYLFGFLKKATGADLKPSDIDLIFKEIEQIQSVHGVIADLENWTITSSEGTWIIVHKGRTQRSAAVAAPQEDYRIDKEEQITDVLEKIPKKT
jgi:hypothetical protein